MVTNRDKLVITEIIESVLGPSKEFRNDEHAYHCPFCNHHKKKLQVNLQSQKWHCWVCNTAGKKVHTLLNRLSVDRRTIQRVKDIYEESSYTKEPEPDDKPTPTLPREFKPLWETPKGLDITYRQAIHYMKSRGITEYDIIKHTIGYVDEGMYSDRVIIPSYDSDMKLNYFIARSIHPENKMKYKNPPYSKNVIMFDSLINWGEPITLVEGVFDALAVKKNAIPLLGKFIPRVLMDKIFKEGVKKINILLDSDAREQSLYYTSYLTNQGIDVSNIVLDGKDPSLVGFNTVNNIIRESKQTSYKELINQKLNI